MGVSLVSQRWLFLPVIRHFFFLVESPLFASLLACVHMTSNLSRSSPQLCSCPLSARLRCTFLAMWPWNRRRPTKLHFCCTNRTRRGHPRAHGRTRNPSYAMSHPWLQQELMLMSTLAWVISFNHFIMTLLPVPNFTKLYKVQVLSKTLRILFPLNVCTLGGSNWILL